MQIAQCKEQDGDRVDNLLDIVGLATIHHSDAGADFQRRGRALKHRHDHGHPQAQGHALKHRREHGHHVLKYLLRAPPPLHEDGRYEVERLQHALWHHLDQ